MFIKQTGKSFLTIAAQTGQFQYKGQLMKTGTTLLANITAARLGWDNGNKAAKIKAGEVLYLECYSYTKDANGEQTKEEYTLQISLRGFIGVKFLCYLPNLKTPFLSLCVLLKAGEEHAALITGHRADEHATNITFAKSFYTFDDAADIFDRQSKETKEPEEILAQWCELLEIPLQDTRMTDREKGEKKAK